MISVDYDNEYLIFIILKLSIVFLIIVLFFFFIYYCGGMKKLKICVYAISKNESKFVKRWVESMQEADEIYVLDTGSTDNTVSLLKEMQVKVTEAKIKPWRFDLARNLSLAMVAKDADICVCTDLDEVFESGWRAKLEEIWQNQKINRVKYLYHWSHNEQGEPSTTFYISKIHARKGFFWKHPVHEVLCVNDKTVESEYLTSSIIVHHYPDDEKSRSSYLPLLEKSVKEDPLDDRNMHYLGREYMFYQKWDDCIRTLHQHLKLKTATWKDERCASMRFLARSYHVKGYIEEAKMWYHKAILEAPYLRESYVELAFLEYESQEYLSSYEHLLQALEIKERSDSYINEVFAWNEFVYDLLSLDCYQLGRLEESLQYLKLALQKNPNDERLLQNFKLISEKKLT